MVWCMDRLFKDERERIVNWAVRRARKNRKASQKKQVEFRKELSRHATMKTQKKVERERKDIEAKVKSVDLRDIQATFPDRDETTWSDLADILTGAAVGRNICHTWYDADTKEKTTYSGRIEKLKERKYDSVCCELLGQW